MPAQKCVFITTQKQKQQQQQKQLSDWLLEGLGFESSLDFFSFFQTRDKKINIFLLLIILFLSLISTCYTVATAGEEGRKCLMREIELGKLLGESVQPNIVKFIGCVTTQGKHLP